MKTEPTEASSIKRANIVDKYLPAGDEQRYYERLKMHEELFDLINSHSPKIKQLEWRYDKSDKIYIAELSMFEYRVWQDNDKSFMKAMINNNHCTILRFRTIDEAKAAAQADFEKRVNECLE